jgi:ribosomal protein S18 acetylase RimI-like enzyme
MAVQPSFVITPVRNQPDLQDTIALFYEYAKSLGFDLSFQDFDGEMAAMPGKYTPPTGELLLARNRGGVAIGCVALRPLGPKGVCEMKRLYVPPPGRGTGVGKALAVTIIETAELLGFSEIRLDTLPSMRAAIAMYEKFGFVDIEAYYCTPMEGTRFLSLKLPRQRSSSITS